MHTTNKKLPAFSYLLRLTVTVTFSLLMLTTNKKLPAFSYLLRSRGLYKAGIECEAFASAQVELSKKIAAAKGQVWTTADICEYATT